MTGETAQDTRLLTMLERATIVCAWLPVFIGIFALVGWLMHAEALVTWGSQVAIKPVTAVSLIMLGSALLVGLNGQPWSRTGMLALTGMSTLLAALSIAQYPLGVDLGVDHWFKAATAHVGSDPYPGRMAPNTGVALIVLGLAVYLLNVASRATVRPFQAAALLGFTLGFTAIVGMLYSSEPLTFMAANFNLIAAPTAVGIVALSISLLCSRPTDGFMVVLTNQSLGGLLLRRLLTVTLLFPLLMGMMRELGELVGFFNPEYGLALYTVIITLLFSGIVWWTALLVDRLARSRMAQGLALSESEERYRNLLETAQEGIWIIDMRARTTYVNARMQEMLGYSSEEMQGRPLYDFVDMSIRPEFETQFRRGADGETETYDFQFRRKDGSTLWAIVASSPIKDSAGNFNGVLKLVSDITTRKESEERILRSEQGMAHAQAVAHVGSWEWDVEGDKITWSAELYRIFGLRPDEFPATFEAYQKLLHPDDRERTVASIMQAFQECAHFEFEHRLCRPSGEVRYVYGRGECVPGHDGVTVLIRGIAQDITERKLTELALLETQQQFASILSNAGMAIYIKDLRGRYIVANEVTLENLGLSSDEVLGATDADLFGDEVAAQYRTNELEVMRTEQVLAIEESVPQRDGPHFYWSVKFPMRDSHGTVIGVGGISNDITSLKRAELALRTSELRIRGILDAAFDAVVSINSEDIIQSWCRQAEELFGWTAEEAVGQSVLLIIPERYREQHTMGMRHYLKTGEGPVLGKVLQIEGLHRDGHEFPIDLAIGQAAKIGDDILFTAFIRDITDRKRAEKELLDQSAQRAKFNAEMQLALTELAQSHQLLQEQAAALERSNADLDDFAYIASHDLKEPLRGISNYAHFLVEDYASKLDPEGQQMLQTLPRLTKRLESLLDALLKYSRLSRTEAVATPTDLQAVVGDVVEMLEARIRETGAEIRIPKPLPTILCDRSLTTEVYLNLISNGIKYNDEASKIVEVGFEELNEGTLSEAQMNGKPTSYVFYVSDNGIGIPEKFQDSVFGAFRRLHSRDKYGGGTGVGLAIVKKMVERQGGRIWLESKPGSGSTFYFTLNAEQVPTTGGVSESRA